MDAISHIFTLRRVAQILGCAEALVLRLSDQLEHEDGRIMLFDIDGAMTLAFTAECIDILRELMRADEGLGQGSAHLRTSANDP